MKILIATFYSKKFEKIYQKQREYFNKLSLKHDWTVLAVGPDNSHIQGYESMGGEAVVDYGIKQIFTRALKEYYNYILITDANVLPEPDTIDKLIEHKADIVGGSVPAIGNPNHVIAHNYVKGTSNELTFLIGEEAKEKYNDKVVEGDGLGIGCSLIKSNIFEQLELHKFKGHYNYKPDWEYYGFSQYMCYIYIKKFNKRPLLDGRVKPIHIALDGTTYRLWGEVGKMSL